MAAGPQRLLKEEDIEIIKEDLCKKCRHHVEYYVHLTCGREGQHIMSDIEVKELIGEINKTDLLTLLTVRMHRSNIIQPFLYMLRSKREALQKT